MSDVFLMDGEKAMNEIVGKTVLKVDRWDVFFTDGTRLEISSEMAYEACLTVVELWGPLETSTKG